MTEFYAHSANEEGYRHGLVEHLKAVTRMARDFASPFGGDEVAYYCGLWHDLDWTLYIWVVQARTSVS